MCCVRPCAQYAQMPEGFDIMLGDGSDEAAVTLVSIACGVPGANFLAPVPGLCDVRHERAVAGHPGYTGVPLTAGLCAGLSARWLRPPLLSASRAVAAYLALSQQPHWHPCGMPMPLNVVVTGARFVGTGVLVVHGRGVPAFCQPAAG
jgi:hypothetical protein